MEGREERGGPVRHRPCWAVTAEQPSPSAANSLCPVTDLAQPVLGCGSQPPILEGPHVSVLYCHLKIGRVSQRERHVSVRGAAAHKPQLRAVPQAPRGRGPGHLHFTTSLCPFCGDPREKLPSALGSGTTMGSSCWTTCLLLEMCLSLFLSGNSNAPTREKLTV